ncbi:MAG: autotransporter outer membrane beta-barrel domain-containing protein [Holosporales bacterium]|nr:autotransporter outer membrane beta-barrel domain-containing protein [Holosporales bacterium]
MCLIATTNGFSATDPVDRKFTEVLHDFLKKDGKDNEFDKDKGVHIVKIGNDNEVTLNGEHRNQLNGSVQLDFNGHDVSIKSISPVDADGKKFKLIEFDNGSTLRAEVNSVTKDATIYFLDKTVDVETVNTSPEDSIVFLPGGELSASKDTGKQRSWKNRGTVTVLPSNTVTHLTALDSGLSGMSMLPPTKWKNKKNARLVTHGHTVIGIKKGISENKGEILAKDDVLEMASGTRLLNYGSVTVDSEFKGDIQLMIAGSKVILHRRDVGFILDDSAPVTKIYGGGSHPISEAAISDLKGSGISEFYAFNPNQRGIIQGKITDESGNELFSGSVSATDARVELVDFAPVDFYTLNEKDAIRMPHSRTVTLDRPGNFRAALFSIDGYTRFNTTEYGEVKNIDNTTIGYGEVEDVDFTTVVEQDIGEGNTIVYDNDNSWYNGVFYVKSGTARISKEGSIPGGDIVVENGAELWWEGGAKDNNNKPTIRLRKGGELIFDLAKRGDKFSVYGKIESDDDKAKIWFDRGKILIKNDCSGFIGTVIVSDGATFTIVKEEHQGQMFRGPIEVDGTAYFETTSGVTPVNLSSGIMVFSKGSSVVDSDVNWEVNNLTVGKRAEARVLFTNAKIRNATVRGVVRVGENAEFTDLNLDGGEIIMAPETAHLHIVSALWGSTLNTMDAKIAEVTVDQLKIRDEHDMFWKLDFDPASETSDHMTVEELHFNEGTSLVVADYTLLSKPVRERYIFNILTILNNGKYPNIRIDSPKEFTGILGKYKLYAEGGLGCVTLRTQDAPFKDATSEQLTILYESVKPLNTLHQINFNSVADMHNFVFSETGTEHFSEKYKFWNKSFYSGMYYKSAKNAANSDDAQIKSFKYSSVFGCDFHATKIDNDSYVVPTVFMDYTYGKTSYIGNEVSKHGRLKECMLGAKVSWFFGKNLFEAIASYAYIGNNLREEGIKKSSIRSSDFGFSAKFSRFYKINNQFSLKPELMIHGSYILNGDYVNDEMRVRNTNATRYSICPGLYIICTNRSRFTLSFGGRWHCELGGNIKSTFGKDDVVPRKMRKGAFEVSLAIKKEFSNKIHIGAEISRQFSSRRGFRAVFSISKEM